MTENRYTLVQITDPHLHASANGTLLGMNTETSLRLIVDRVQQEVSNIDLILATGDIAQDSSLQAYKNFLTFIEPLQSTMRWIPGNHDNRERMAEACNGTDCNNPVVELGDWVILMLDSKVPHKVYGEVDDEQLNWLDQNLTQYQDKYILVCLHHHPVPMNSQWIDRIDVRNKAALNRIIHTHNNVKAVVFGHVHQESDRVEHGIRFLSTPSTCVQFLPESSDFGIDSLGPGYRTLHLYKDGRIDTHVSRIDGIDFDIDFTQKGY